LTIAASNNETFSYKVLNSTGIVVEGVSESTSPKHTINVSGWSQGVYIIHIYSEGKLTIEKIVIK